MGSGFWPRLGALVGGHRVWGALSCPGSGLQVGRDLWKTEDIGLEQPGKKGMFWVKRPLIGRGWGSGRA